MIKKLVIPAAGVGKRLLPLTKEIPKEMLPIFEKSGSKNISVKPLIQILFEQFYLEGLREFCLIVGKQKRTIEDHFTPDYNFLKSLDSIDRNGLEKFYTMIKKSHIFWVNQHEPKGFGDAVLASEAFVGDQDFIVSAGDTLLPKGNKTLKQILNYNLKGKYDALIVLKEVDDPSRFGVAVVKQSRNEFIVKNVEEKPKKPKSNLSIVALYRFRPSIFDALKSVKYQKELQLTDAIQNLIDRGGKINAILMKKTDQVIDVGTPKSYLENFARFYK